MQSKANRSVLLVSGAVLAIGLAGTGLMLFRGGSGPRPPGDAQVEVLVVRQDLPVRTLMDESAIRTHIARARVRRDRVPPGAVTDEQRVRGKTALRNIRAGEYLTDTDVGRPIRDFIPNDFRAYSVQLNPEDGGTDAFRPGDRVDLVVVVRVGRGRIVSEPIVQGLLVLAVNATDHALAVGVNPSLEEAIRANEHRGDLRAVPSEVAK